MRSDGRAWVLSCSSPAGCSAGGAVQLASRFSASSVIDPTSAVNANITRSGSAAIVMPSYASSRYRAMDDREVLKFQIKP